jgi:hypothetical protein
VAQRPICQFYGYTTLGVTFQQALRGYVDFMANGNTGFNVSGFRPEYGVTRINAVPEPEVAPVSAVAVAAAAFVRWRRRAG